MPVGADDEKLHAVPADDLRDDLDGVPEAELCLYLDVVFAQRHGVPFQAQQVFLALRVARFPAQRLRPRALDAVQEQEGAAGGRR